MQTQGSQRLNLVCNIGTSITDVAIHLTEDADVLIAVKQGILVLPVHAGATRTAMRGLVRLEARVGQNDNKSLRVLISRGDGGLLFCNELRQRGRRQRLGSGSLNPRPALGRRHGGRLCEWEVKEYGRKNCRERRQLNKQKKI